MIDGHHHLWQLARGDYGWIGGGTNPAVASIERDFLADEFRSLAAANGISGSVLVQAAPTIAETRWLLEQARSSEGLIRGVVGWIDMTAGEAPAALEKLARDPLLRGIRPMLQDIADEQWILQPDVAPALEAIVDLDLSFDLLVKPRHLIAAHALLERHPDLRAIVDHCAKPDIAGGAWQPWADDLRRVAEETSALCKLSGLITEARPGCSSDELRRYADHVIDCFGPSRVVWGSDWPVMLLNGSYAQWRNTALGFVSRLSPAEQRAILHDNAERFYQLAAA